MKLSKKINELQKILKKYGDLEVVYSTDDEGNDFNIVSFPASVGEYSNGEWTGKDDLEPVKKINAVCIN